MKSTFRSRLELVLFAQIRGSWTRGTVGSRMGRLDAPFGLLSTRVLAGAAGMAALPQSTALRIGRAAIWATMCS